MCEDVVDRFGIQCHNYISLEDRHIVSHCPVRLDYGCGRELNRTFTKPLKRSTCPYRSAHRCCMTPGSSVRMSAMLPLNQLRHGGPGMYRRLELYQLMY